MFISFSLNLKFIGLPGTTNIFSFDIVFHLLYFVGLDSEVIIKVSKRESFVS